MVKVCGYCGRVVEFKRDDSGLLYCPLCGFYEEESEEPVESEENKDKK